MVPAFNFARDASAELAAKAFEHGAKLLAMGLGSKGYDQRGNRIVVRDADGHETHFDYDDRGNKIYEEYLSVAPQCT